MTLYHIFFANSIFICRFFLVKRKLFMNDREYFANSEKTIAYFSILWYNKEKMHDFIMHERKRPIYGKNIC